MRYLPLLLLAMLTACATTQEPHPVVLVPETQTVNIPDHLLQTCPPMPKLQAKAYTEGEMVDLLNQWITMSEACRAKQAILVTTVKQAFNIKSPSTVPNSK